MAHIFPDLLTIFFPKLPILEIWHSNIISKLKHSIQKNDGLPLINKRFSDLSILFLERSIVMGDLVSSQIPFVFHSFVTQSAGNGATRCMHVQYVLKEKLLILQYSLQVIIRNKKSSTLYCEI